MPFARPTLTSLIQQAQQDIIAGQITDQTTGNILQGLLAQANLLDVATSEAGLVYGLYAYLDYISLQAVPYKATDEWLEGWAALKSILRKAASAATGTFSIASGATNDVVLPAASVITRSDGTEYTTDAAATVTAGVLSVSITCSTTGSTGTLVTGSALSIASPPAGIPAAGTATAGTAGADQETDDDLRTRMLLAYAAPPQGGDAADYVEWAESVDGVTRAWVNPNGAGAGTVVVYTMWDDAESAFNGFPQGANGVATNECRDTAATGDQLAVANAIYPDQPVTALVYSVAPIAMPVAFTITNLGTSNTAAIQTAITTALQDMFLRLGNVGGTSDPTTRDPWPAIDPSDWYAAISSVTGIGRFTVTEPTAPITPGTGQLPVLSVPPTFSS